MTNDNDLIRRGDALELFDAPFLGGVEDMIRALPAVAASQSANPVINADSRQRMTVKPLVWRKDGSVWSAKTKIGEYRVANIHGEWMWFFAWMPKSNEDKIDKGRVTPNTEVAAKAAAFANCERRILAFIDAQPAPRDAQIAALVEALKSMIDGYQEWDMVGTTPVLRPNHLQTSWIQRANAALTAIAAVKGGDA